jgi:hypothetical protein
MSDTSVTNGTLPKQDPNGGRLGRTATGTFAPGNAFGKGNPHARRLAEWRDALTSTITADQVQALGAKLYAAAIDGDWVAAKLLLEYLVGKPARMPDLDKGDVRPIVQLVVTECAVDNNGVPLDPQPVRVLPERLGGPPRSLEALAAVLHELSNADRERLRQVLTEADARDVNGQMPDVTR